MFGLPDDSPLILFGSVGPLSNQRKRYHLLMEEVDEFWKPTDTDAAVVVFGRNKPDNPPDFDPQTHYTDYLNDEESLAMREVIERYRNLYLSPV